MHDFWQDYNSLIIGSVALLGLAISGFVSNNREKARRLKTAASQAARDSTPLQR